MRVVCRLLVLVTAVTAHAEPVRLRMAALAPEGTAWAREMHTLAREIESETRGQVQLKWYLGGIAGDELTVLHRIRKEQLDGTAGALFCEKLAPTFKVNRVVGLFQSRAESNYVLSSLRNQLNQEFARSGFVLLATGNFGNMMLFTREPVRTLADLKRMRLWIYDLDETLIRTLRGMGANVVALPVGEALKAFDDGRVDGFLTPPTVALAFQWSSRVKYYTDLTMSMLPGCFVVAQRSFDALPIEHQRVIRAAAAKFGVRFDEVGQITEKQLLGGLFERQGVKRIPVDAAMRENFYQAARLARESVGDLVDSHLIDRVLSLLADYRGLRQSSN
jgi:TRAP-type C4-dicarboxylate transport system substrate-binding protein